MKDLRPILGTVGLRQEHTLDRTQVYCTHGFRHIFTPGDKLQCYCQSVHLPACFWEVGGNLKTWRKLTGTWDKHAKLRLESGPRICETATLPAAIRCHPQGDFFFSSILQIGYIIKFDIQVSAQPVHYKWPLQQGFTNICSQNIKKIKHRFIL